MATYYFPPRQRGASASAAGSNENYTHEPEELVITRSQQDSLYIFPNPPTSEPPSPGSSLFSVPSSFPLSPSSSVPSSPSGLRSFFDRNSNRIIGSGFGNDALFAGAAGPPLATHVITPTADYSIDPDVEVWNWRGDSPRASSFGGGSWVYTQGQRPVDPEEWQLQPPPDEASYHRTSRDFVFEHRPARRVSKESTETMFKLSFSSRSPSRSRVSTIHPRSQLPLLSFFASFFLDHDDPTVQLLAYESPPNDESLLFPGQSDASLTSSHAQLRAIDDDPSTDADNSDWRPRRETLQVELHGLERLFASSAELTGLHSLRDGLAVSIPSPLDLVRLCRTMGEVCTRGHQALRELWTDVKVQPLPPVA